MYNSRVAPTHPQMKAMILAAGEGTRLRPLTLALPKPMAPIANVPLLARTLGLLAGQGVVDVAVNLFHRPEAIHEALGDGSRLGLRRLHFSPEETLLGTAGGVRRLASFLDETFLVLYGDNLYHFDVAPLVAFHREKKAVATIATFEAENPSACGLVATDAGGRVTRFQEKPPPAEVFTNQANAGVYVLDPAIFGHLPPDDGHPLDWGNDVFPRLLPLGILYSAPLNGYLRDTGTPDAYRQANWDVLDGATGEPPTATLVGRGASVAATATLAGRNVLGDGVTVASGAHLADTIVWAGSRIGVGARVTGAVLGRNVTVGDGAVVGEGALLADGAVVKPNAVCPPGARVSPNTTVADFPKPQSNRTLPE